MHLLHVFASMAVLAVARSAKLGVQPSAAPSAAAPTAAIPESPAETPVGEDINDILLQLPVEENSNAIQEPEEEAAVSDVDVWPSKDITFGQVTAVSLDSKGNVHVFHRGARTWDRKSFDGKGTFLQKAEGPIKEHTHLVIDKDSGALLSKHAADRFYMPHGLRVDSEDNVWVTDVAMHQVFKFPAGKDVPSLVLGEAFKQGSDHKHFCQPTSVAIAKSGEFFVADGYCNSRVMKFSPDGVFIIQFGKSDDGVYPPPNGAFAVPHGLALVEDWDVVCVADREHQRIQCFSAGLSKRSIPTGTFFRKAEGLGRVFGLDAMNHYLVGVTNSGLVNGKSQLFVVDMETGDSLVQQPDLSNPHDVAVAEDGSIYIAEIGPNTVRRIHL